MLMPLSVKGSLKFYESEVQSRSILKELKCGFVSAFKQLCFIKKKKLLAPISSIYFRLMIKNNNTFGIYLFSFSPNTGT